jgi:hypothetical protein
MPFEFGTGDNPQTGASDSVKVRRAREESERCSGDSRDSRADCYGRSCFEACSRGSVPKSYLFLN